MDRANIVGKMKGEMLKEVKSKMIRLGLRWKGERTWSANSTEVSTAVTLRTAWLQQLRWLLMDVVENVAEFIVLLDRESWWNMEPASKLWVDFWGF